MDFHTDDGETSQCRDLFFHRTTYLRSACSDFSPFFRVILIDFLRRTGSENKVAKQRSRSEKFVRVSSRGFASDWSQSQCRDPNQVRAATSKEPHPRTLCGSNA
jgi:hypothetical protein